MKYEITVGEQAHTVEIEALGEETAEGLRRYRLRVDGGPTLEVERGRAVADVLSLLIGGHAWEAGLVSTPEGFDVELVGVRHEVAVVDPRRKALRMAARSSSGGAVVTQMPGRVVALLVQEGAVVQKGQTVVIIEAMKMENPLKAPRDGVVRSIRVAVGDLVESRATLLELVEGEPR